METLLPILILSAPFALLLGLAYSVSHNMSRHVDEVLLGLRGQMGKVTLRLEKMENKVDVMERRLRTRKGLENKGFPGFCPLRPRSSMARKWKFWTWTTLCPA